MSPTRAADPSAIRLTSIRDYNSRSTFIGSPVRSYSFDWDQVADITVAIIRTEAGRDPHDKVLHDLVW